MAAYVLWLEFLRFWCCSVSKDCLEDKPHGMVWCVGGQAEGISLHSADKA